MSSIHKAGYVLHGHRYEHRLVAENVLGRPLPKGARVHHVDGNPANNKHDNLVLCPNEAYHQLLHIRTEAYITCGHADWRKCGICSKYDAPNNLTESKRANRGVALKISSSSSWYHKSCMAEKGRLWRARQKNAR